MRLPIGFPVFFLRLQRPPATDYSRGKGGLDGAGRCEEPVARRPARLWALAKRHRVNLPLTAAGGAIAAGRVKPRLAIDMLMRREATSE